MSSVSKATQAFPTGPTLKLYVIEGKGGGGQQASCLVAKQAVEFPQVLASYRLANSHYIVVSLKILQQISSSHYYVANTHYKYI